MGIIYKILPSIFIGGMIIVMALSLSAVVEKECQIDNVSVIPMSGDGEDIEYNVVSRYSIPSAPEVSPRAIVMRSGVKKSLVDEFLVTNVEGRRQYCLLHYGFPYPMISIPTTKGVRYMAVLDDPRNVGVWASYTIIFVVIVIMLLVVASEEEEAKKEKEKEKKKN